MNKKYNIITYGCQMNVHDSEKIAGMLNQMGYVECKDNNEADVIVFNTCCIRENAEDRAEGNIGALKTLKREHKNLIIAVGGCMTQQSEKAEKLKKKFPFIDIIFGTHNLNDFRKLLEKKIRTHKSIVEILEKELPIDESSPIFRTSYPNAWINIAYGCNNFCSYCIVPYVRGRERSRNMNSILEEVRNLVKDGYKEITFLGQNVNSYGNDLNDGTTFSKLMAEATKIEGKFRLRFMTNHPKDLSEDLIKVIAENDKICNYIHLPIQSGSNFILKEMNRKYTREDYMKNIELIRKNIPKVAISTDIMVGFPKETEQDFLDTMDLIEKVNFNSAFMFVYSKRSGTKAYDMIEQIPEDVKKDRIIRLVASQNKITADLSEKCQGMVVEVLCESYDEKKQMYSGRDELNHIVYFESKNDVIGEFINIKIIKTGGVALYGEIV